MAILFRNEGNLPIEAIRNFGVSVKSEDAIGYFGTGLKYGIAVLMRNDCRIRLWTGGKGYEFVLVSENIRGKDFLLVHLAPIDEDGSLIPDETVPMGFTTDLGRDWETWMGFRELFCNTMDEGGTVAKRPPPPSCFEPEDDVTLIVVEGREIEKCWENRSETFLTTQAKHAGPISEAHLGEGRFVYYRGIRVYDLQERSMFNYNILSTVTLTEDRTLKYAFEAKNAAMSCVLSSEDSHFIEQFLSAPEGYFEHSISFDTHMQPTEVFLDTVENMWRNLRAMNMSARKFYLQHRRENLNPEDSVKLDPIEQEKLRRAVEACTEMGCMMRRYPIVVLDSFEDDAVVGKAEDNTIFISRRTFDMGTKYLASTIYEEYLHLERGLKDCTREMQNFLFERLFTEYEKRRGEPL